VNFLLFCCCSQFWAKQYHHDLFRDVVHISVDPGDRVEASKFLKEFSADLYELDDPHDTVLVSTADHASLNHPTPVICPGTTVYANNHQFLFSGLIGDCNSQVGITVAHAIGPGCNISLDPGGNNFMGQCTKKYECVVHREHGKVTADLAVLNLSETLVFRNAFNWFQRPLNIKLYKGPIGKPIPVMIYVANGEIVYGWIRNILNEPECSLTEGSCMCVPCEVRNTGIFNMLGICSWQDGDKPATGAGDSGALVMSPPRPGSDDIDVYGFVVGIFKDNGRYTMTIANSLQHVIPSIASIGSSITDGIDFVSC